MYCYRTKHQVLQNVLINWRMEKRELMAGSWKQIKLHWKLGAYFSCRHKLSRTWWICRYFKVLELKLDYLSGKYASSTQIFSVHQACTSWVSWTQMKEAKHCDLFWHYTRNRFIEQDFSTAVKTEPLKLCSKSLIYSWEPTKIASVNSQAAIVVRMPLETRIASCRCSLLAHMQREQHFGWGSAGKAVLQENVHMDRVQYLGRANKSISPTRRS